ncbi:MAG TPA: DUF4388 domain-containing protein [Sandaracinaceae bacterium]
MSSVLVVHADGAAGAQLASAIARAGHEVRVAASGERAMDCFIQEPADVVVIDDPLAGRDGLSTAEAIRWMPGGRRARVILTAPREPGESSLAELGRSVDAFRVMVGPLDPDEVARAVEEAAAVRPEEAETRVLEVERALLAAEKARARAVEPRPLEPTVVASAEPGRPGDRAALDEPDGPGWEWRDTDGRLEGREVRAMAEATAGAQSDLVGSFETMPFARVLHRLARKRATGALVCVHPPDGRPTTEGTEPTKVVYVRAGVPVHVRSNLVSECLGQVLARTRRIGPATLRESLSAVQRGEGRQGEVLVQLGAIGPLELSEALAEQLRIKLFDLFAWRRGTFRFAADRPPPPELIELGLGLAEIAVLGVRQGMPPPRVLEKLAPHRARRVVPRPRELVRFLQLHLPEPLAKVIRAIDGSRTLRELLEESDDPAGAAQLVHAMECLDAIRFEDAPPSPRAAEVRAPQEDESWAGSTPLDEDALEEDARWLAATGTNGSPRDRAQRAPRELDGPPPPRHDGASPESSADALELDEHTDEDGALARDPPSFGASLAEIAPPAPPSLDRPVPVLPPTSPERPAPKGRDGERLPSDLPPSESGSGLRKKEDAAVLDERVERLLAAERHFRRGQRSLDRERFDEAVAAFARAVELCPEEGRFLAYLGWAKHAAAPDDLLVLSEAIELAERGCVAAPELAVAHLLRARMLAAAGRRDEARTAFARVVELDPSNEEARSAARG